MITKQPTFKVGDRVTFESELIYRMDGPVTTTGSVVKHMRDVNKQIIYAVQLKDNTRWFFYECHLTKVKK